MSGTWVVQDKLLCGVIVAAYSDDAYAHMITAEKMFQDIREFQPNLLHDLDISVATEDDTRRIYGGRPNTTVHAPYDHAPNSLWSSHSGVQALNANTPTEDHTLSAHESISGGRNVDFASSTMSSRSRPTRRMTKPTVIISAGVSQNSKPLLLDNSDYNDSSKDTTSASSTPCVETSTFNSYKRRYPGSINDDYNTYPHSPITLLDHANLSRSAYYC